MSNEKKRATPKSLKEYLTYYYKARSKVLKEHGREYFIRIPLTLRFLEICENRVREAHKKYGQDWKTKDNLKEAEFEKYDIVNYDIQARMQKAYRKKVSR